MRQYYLCNPANQAITGPHPLADLITLAKDGAITAEWYVAEPGSDIFLALSESFSLNEILFHGGAVPVEPPPVAGVKLKSGPQKPSNLENEHTDHKTNHHAEFAKVLEKSQNTLRQKTKTPKPAPANVPPHTFKPPHLQDSHNPETILQDARRDLAQVLKMRDDNNFNPPTYWQSSAGERMRTFLYAEMFVFIFALLILGIFVLLNKVTIVLIMLLLGAVVMLTVGLAFLVFFMMS